MTFRLSNIEAHRKHFRSFDNTLDMLCYRRRFPAIAVHGLSGRFSHMNSTRRWLSYGFVAWIAFGLGLYLVQLLPIYFMLTGFPANPKGFDYYLLNYRISSEDLEALRSGNILVDDEGQTVLDPHLDFIMIISLQSDDEMEIERKIRECCFERGSVWPRRAIVLIDYGPETSYQEIIDVVDQLWSLEPKHGCKTPSIQFAHGS